MTCHFAQDPLQGASLRHAYSQGSSATSALGRVRRQVQGPEKPQKPPLLVDNLRDSYEGLHRGWPGRGASSVDWMYSETDFMEGQNCASTWPSGQGIH